LKIYNPEIFESLSPAARRHVYSILYLIGSASRDPSYGTVALMVLGQFSYIFGP